MSPAERSAASDSGASMRNSMERASTTTVSSAARTGSESPSTAGAVSSATFQVGA